MGFQFYQAQEPAFFIGRASCAHNGFTEFKITLA